jgi:hypothetical protein
MATEPTTAIEAVHPDAEGFRERVTPKPLGENLFAFKCACGRKHFRHAGYMQFLMPYLKPGGEKRVSCEEYRVMVCVACKRSFVWANEQMHDVTDQIDLEAWERTEREAHKATGPGGQC